MNNEYRHKGLKHYEGQDEILGDNGIKQFVDENPGKDFSELKSYLDYIDKQSSQITHTPYDMSSPEMSALYNACIEDYPKYFNVYGQKDRKATVLIGGISSGKSTIASMIAQMTNSMIVDSDIPKIGQMSPKGFYPGLSSIYDPINRNRVQLLCTEITEKIIKNAAQTGLNIVLPTSGTSPESIQKRVAPLVENNYDIDLILIECPLEKCADRNNYRFLIREFAFEKSPVGNYFLHGRFVNKSVVKMLYENSFLTFSFLRKSDNSPFKSYKAYQSLDNMQFDEINVDTMEYE